MWLSLSYLDLITPGWASGAAVRVAPETSRRQASGFPEAEENGLDDEEVQVTAYRCQRFAADPAQLASGSLIGYGTDLLSHSVRNLFQSGDVIRRDLYVMVEVAIAAGERHRKEQSGDH